VELPGATFYRGDSMAAVSRTDKHILVVSGRDASVVRLRGLPIEVTLIQTADFITRAQINAADRVFVLDLADRELVKRLIVALHTLRPISAVMCFLEPFLVTAGHLRDMLNATGFSEKAAALTKNKILMRAQLEKSDLPKVKWKEARNSADIVSALSEIGSPLIVKPADGWASIDVSLLWDQSEAQKAFNKAAAGGGGVIVEEFIDGPEFSVEGISRRGHHEILAVTRKTTTGPPNFVEIGHVQPSGLATRIVNRIEVVVCELLDHMGVEFGPSHTEIRVKNDEPFIIETHTRHGADRIWELTEFTTGVSIQRTTACYLLELDPPGRRPVAPAAAVRFLTAEPGIVINIEAPARFDLPDEVIRLVIEVKPGDTVKELVSSFSRCGYVLTVGNSAEDAQKLAEEVASRVRINTAKTM